MPCRLWLGVAASLIVIVAGSAAAEQSVKITAINGTAVPQDEVYADGDVLSVSWQAVDTDCNKGAWTVQLYVDGVAQNGAGSGFGGTFQLANLPDCRHVVELRYSMYLARVPRCMTPGNWTSSAPAAFWSTPYASCTTCADCDKNTVGKPVDVATGRMFHSWTDLRVRGPLPIVFTRRYDSQSTYDGPLGYGWQHSYSMRLLPAGNNRIVFIDDQGRRIFFNRLATGGWDASRIDHLVLSELGTPAWRITTKERTAYDFDSGGTLRRIADRNGNELTFSYTGSDLTAIADSFGRIVSLTYLSGKLQTLVAGDRTIRYALTNDNLSRVDLADGSHVTYEYGDPNHPHDLTAARDGLEHIIESHTYEVGPTNRVLHTESDGGVDAYTLSYDSPTQTTVTNGRGFATVYNVDSFSGLVAASAGPDCAACGSGGTHVSLTYDRWHNLLEKTDGRGYRTSMTYDGNGNMLSRTEAVGTPRERKAVYTYDPTFNFVWTITVPSVGSCGSAKIVTYTHDHGNGDLTSEQVTGCAGGDTFSATTTYTYDSHGQVATIDGPRTDVADVTTTSYYADDDPDLTLRGRRHIVTDALGHAAATLRYDLFGNPLAMLDVNQAETDYTCDGADRRTVTVARGRVPENDAITITHYDAAGRADWIRRPTCVDAGVEVCPASASFVYDNANRLTMITNAAQEKIVYTLDSEGNRIREEFRDVADAVQRYTNFAFDQYNRLQYVYYTNTVPPAPGSVYSSYQYDDNGNRVSDTDPAGHTISYAFDEIGRLATTSSAIGGQVAVTTYAYDVQDNVVSVKDPNALTTTYENHDMGWRLVATSPDSGITTNTFDVAGNVKTSRDAKGNTTTRVYDALSRIVAVTYSDPTLNLTYSYDSPSAAYGVGRRTEVSDAVGTSTFTYTSRGMLAEETRVIDGAAYVTAYAYDKDDNRIRVSPPSPNRLAYQGETDYTFDFSDRATTVRTAVDGALKNVVTGLQYKPFGPPASMTFGNGLADLRSYDSRYQIQRWTVDGTLDYAHVFDNDGNLTHRIDNRNGGLSRTFGYDEAHRLVAASGPWGSGANCADGKTYGYDLNGNRLCKGEGAEVDYAYQAGSNRLLATNGGEVRVLSYDADGNITGDGQHTYEFGASGRLMSVDSGRTAVYAYDAEGRRASKMSNGVRTLYFYDPSGWLLTEMAGCSGKDYLYLGAAPVARLDWSIAEVDAGDVLRLGQVGGNVHLDWSVYPAGSHLYAIRRKRVVDGGDKSFSGSVVAGSVADPVRVFDDPVLGDGETYAYSVVAQVGSATPVFYHTDQLGTPIVVTNALGAVVWQAEYRPFGDVFSLPQPAGENGLRFPGQIADAETSFYQNWFRDYSPQSGRYLEPDPLGLLAGRNVFVYVSNNPTGQTDRTGLAEGMIYVCCAAAQFTGNARGWKHCYIQVGRKRYELQPRETAIESTGIPQVVELPVDPDADCAGTRGCNLKQCVADAHRRYPSGGRYNAWNGPNSNTYAATIARECHLNKPGSANQGEARGWDYNR